MPLLMVLAMARWNADYDKVLIANVESDLRIAEQYLGQLQANSARALQELASSARLARVLSDGAPPARFLDTQREALQLDFLYLLQGDALTREKAKWPVVHEAAAGRMASEIDIFPAAELEAVSPTLAARARIELIETEAAAPTDRRVEDRGMVVHSAAPIRVEGHRGVLVGGMLLNRNLDFIDTINALVYLHGQSDVSRQGTATLFLDDTRVSTNVRLFEDVRALGTRVSAAVREAVLGQGKTWLDRAFVVDDWYISGYLPLTNSFGTRVGMLYVGFLEAPYQTAKREAYWIVVGAFALVIALSAPLFLWLAKGIFAPLERMTRTMARVERGDLTARNGTIGRHDEIGQVADHLDTLLDQVQERDRRLRNWADELNTRVEERTRELKIANEKLEETFRQLVMSEKLASIGEITAGVAHEINNPVAVIQGNVDVMRMTLGDGAEPVRTELDLIDNQVMRIGAIVGKLLQFARPSEFGTFAEHVDVAAVVRDCLVLVDHVISKQEIRVLTQFDDAPCVRIDPGELQQVIINLIINASQAMDGQGTLALSVAGESRNGHAGVALRIADTGPGIPADRIGQIFDPFFTTKQGEGTGLGLSISQTLIQRAGGHISVRNRRARGAEFLIWLPGPDQASDAPAPGIPPAAAPV
ncbi:HAMP domain-containing sensor histidine kinase [Epibacterium sp. Ofav1-8]|uniref:HAMP domain-containing sensor histidine kinase n=1 Tax=Epibacterium sp. Ofav1-8 TaxID=2917735 RepID=UPI001EF6F876|nr:HAMP domain-containing sensor histidine kinase [Epibacterium sp. Ofav1-8]MCG7624241.1 cache domain-containing protein [Epibacterium sp. Ofav1-8]